MYMLSLWQSFLPAVLGNPFGTPSPVHQDIQGLRGFSHAPASAAQQQAVIAQATTIVNTRSATQQARAIIRGMGFSKRESLALAQTLYPDGVLPPDVSSYPELVRIQEEVSARLAAYAQLATHGEQTLESAFAEVGCCLKDETKQGVRQELQALQARDAPVATPLAASTPLAQAIQAAQTAQTKAPTDTWVKTLNGESFDFVQSITAVVDGGFAVAGYTSSVGAGPTSFLIAKLDAGGNKVWIKTLGGALSDYAASITATLDGGFVVAGYTESAGAGFADALIAKLDASGNKVWIKTLGGTLNDYAASITALSDGGFVITGFTKSAGAGSDDLLIAKLDANGNKVWAKTLGGASSDIGTSIVATPDGGFVVAGYTESAGAGSEDFLIVKLDANGNKVWVKTLGGASDDFAQSITALSDGSFVVVGFTASAGAGSNDFLIAKLDANGNKVWCRTLGGVHVDDGLSITAPPDGGFVVIGYTDGNVLTAKLDSNGNIDGCSWLRDVTGSFTQTTPTWVTVDAELTVTDAGASVALADAGLVVQDVSAAFAETLICLGNSSPSPIASSSAKPSPTTTPSITPSQLSLTRTASITPSTAPSTTPSPTDHPVVVNGGLSDQTLLVGEPFQRFVPLDLFTDAGAAVIQLSARQANAAPLPAWLHFDPLTRRFSGTPLSGSQGDLALVIEGSDGHHVETVSFTLQVLDRTPVLAIPPADQLAVVGKSFSFVLPTRTFNDPDGDPLQFNAVQATGVSLPAWLRQRTVMDAGKPTLELFGLPNEAGETRIRVTVDDGFGRSAVTVFSIFVETQENADDLARLVGAITGSVAGGFLTLAALMFGYLRREGRVDPYLQGKLKGLRYIQSLESFHHLEGEHLRRLLPRLELTYQDEAGKNYRGMIKKVMPDDNPMVKVFHVEFSEAFGGTREHTFNVMYGGSEAVVTLDAGETPIALGRIDVQAVRSA
ncbi:MAG: putative Ig domain-containing protein, partial [Pseudomonadota bacterium]